MNKFSLILLIILFIISNTKLILPLKFINVNQTYNKIDQDFLSSLYSNNLYLNMSIGSNEEIIKGILDMEQIGFYIYENAYSYNLSSSFLKTNKSKNFYKRNNEEGFISNDTICLNHINDIINNKFEKCEDNKKVSFVLLKSNQKNIEENIYETYSIIGLQQNDYFDEKVTPLFVQSLKESNIIDSHLFSFYFNKNENGVSNEFIGYLLLGNNSEIKENENIEIIKFSTERKYGFPFWGITFDQVSIGLNNSNNTSASGDNKYKTFQKEVELVASLPYILGIYDYNVHVKFYFFYDLLQKNICKYVPVPYNPEYSTYVCDGKSDLFIQYYNTKFTNLYFIHKDSNSTFVLDKNDLFSYNFNNKSDTHIYFLVLFYNSLTNYDKIKRFKLGIPFFKKYNFSFHPEDRVINYYRNKIMNNNEKEDKIRNNDSFVIIIKIIIIIVLLVIVFCLGILFHKFVIKSPKKKLANELDDDYEYKTNPIINFE